jgi:hypothetical protein
VSTLASPLNAKSAHLHGGPEPGRRAPIREGEPAVGSGNTPRFALFAEDTPASRSLLSKYANFLEPSPRKPYADGGIWIVRPDGSSPWPRNTTPGMTWTRI